VINLLDLKQSHIEVIKRSDRILIFMMECGMCGCDEIEVILIEILK